jgi:3-oxoisoapionate kinase
MNIDLLLAYYADDFTGATDVLEALSASGVATVLFTEPPDAEILRKYPHVSAIGVAGTSRTMSPDEMEQSLPPTFHALRSHRPRIVHYKVCSTFDSSPKIGSIGRAIDIGQRTFANHFVPLVVGAPVLGRYCVFGNLHARSGLDSVLYRLDRHPTMRAHPITPMTEADLRVHLGRQTLRGIELVDVLVLERGQDAAAEAVECAAQTIGNIVLFDVLTDNHLTTIGRLICEAQEREQKPLFAAGSSGIEYALAQHWRATGMIPAADGMSGSMPPPQAVDRVLVVSGSCSPATDRQIAWALQHGFIEVPLDVASWCNSEPAQIDIDPIVKRIVQELNAGSSVITHTSRGPDDGRIIALEQARKEALGNSLQIGVILGRILQRVIQAGAVGRVAVVGGDTSGQVARSLGIKALEFARSLDPGAPLCIARSRDPAVDGLQIVFKGGQVGYDDFFCSLLSGRSSHLPDGIRK